MFSSITVWISRVLVFLRLPLFSLSHPSPFFVLERPPIPLRIGLGAVGTVLNTAIFFSSRLLHAPSPHSPDHPPFAPLFPSPFRPRAPLMRPRLCLPPALSHFAPAHPRLCFPTTKSVFALGCLWRSVCERNAKQVLPLPEKRDYIVTTAPDGLMRPLRRS